MADRDTDRLLAILAAAEKSEDKDRAFEAVRSYLTDKAEGDIEENGAVKIAPLKLAFEKVNQKHAFQPGTMVKWKADLKNRRVPKYGEPMVVIEYISENIPLNEHGPATPLYREPLDLALGTIDDDNEFMIYHYDSRRFEPF